MKKVLLCLLLPFFMVMSMSAISILDSQHNYDGAYGEVLMQVLYGENGGFTIKTTNNSTEDLEFDVNQCFAVPTDKNGDLIGDLIPMFTEEDIEEDFDFVESDGGWMNTEEFFFDESAYMGFHFVIYIGGEETTWDVIVSER